LRASACIAFLHLRQNSSFAMLPTDTNESVGEPACPGCAKRSHLGTKLGSTGQNPCAEAPARNRHAGNRSGIGYASVPERIEALLLGFLPCSYLLRRLSTLQGPPPATKMYRNTKQ
jgi:hypothetical protein